MMRNHSFQPGKARRGVLYVHVMLISLLVSLIAVTSLRVHRSQAHEQHLIDQLNRAKQLSRFGVQVAVAEMKQDPRWRETRGGGVWVTDANHSDGAYWASVGPTQPSLISRDLRDAINLQTRGKLSAAVYQTGLKVKTRAATSTCLEAAIMCGKKMEFNDSVIHCGGLIASNDDVKASDSMVTGDVQAEDKIDGDVYFGTQTEKVAHREMPDPDNVFDYYLNQGTWISAASLPSFRAPEMLPNTNFEQNLDHWRWVGDYCELERSDGEVRSGQYSLLVKNREDKKSFAAQVFESGQGGIGRFISGHEYRLTIPTRPVEESECRAVCVLVDSEGEEHEHKGKETEIDQEHWRDNGFQNVSVDFRPDFSGRIVRCEVFVKFERNRKDYNLDDVSLVDITFPAGTKVIERVALTPSSNPFGLVNDEGIYIIDCGGSDVIIHQARIEGTVVLRNPGNLSGVYGPVAWRVPVGGRPALMSDKSLIIAMTDGALNEAELNVNLNPPSAPWPHVGGTSNTTMNDCYGSQISGLIYAAKDIEINGVLNLHGLCIADEDVKAEGAVVRVQYDADAAMNPPPGFDVGQRPLSIVSGSWRRVID